MHDVARVVRGWRDEGVGVAVARGASTSGFGARTPGEALAVAADGRVAGGLLGGAVDGGALPVLRRLAGGGDPELLEVPVGADEAAACGLACSGVARVLVAPAGAVPDAVWEALAAGRAAALATTVGPGGRGRALDAVGGAPHGDDAVAAALADLGRLGRSDATVVDLDGVPTVVERWLPEGRLVLCGAAGLAAAVEAQARLLGWAVDVLDVGAAAAAAALAGPADAVAVLSHEPEVDEPVLVAALGSTAGYVGALGSRGAQQARRTRLGRLGVDEAALDRLHGPVGLDLGPTTPQEVALAICAEVLAVRSGRTGAALRATEGRITG